MADDGPDGRERREAPPRLQDNMSQGQRNRAIDEFIESFSDWDWGYFWARFKRPKITVFASLGDLPVEVLREVAAYVSLSDVLNARAVSREWRTVWTDSDVLRGVCHRYFPGAWQCLNDTVPFKTQFDGFTRQNATPAGKDWTTTALHWNIGPQAASSSSRAGIVANTLPNLASYPPKLIYAAGKVAWQALPSFVVIDDLEQGTWHRVSFLRNRMAGESTKLLAFSGELVVVGQLDEASEDQDLGSSCRKVLVHHVSSKSQKPLTLPNNLTQCFAQADSLVFVTRGPEVFSYRWGGTMKQLDIPHGQAAPNLSVEAALFHPTKPDTVFILAATEEVDSVDNSQFARSPNRRGREAATVQMSILKYHEGRMVRQQNKSMNRPMTKVRCAAANKYGLYTLYTTTANDHPHHCSTALYSVVTDRFYERSGVIDEDEDPRVQAPPARLWNGHALQYMLVDCLAIDHRLVLSATPYGSALPERLTSQGGSVWRSDAFKGMTESEQRLSGMNIELYVSDEWIVMSSEHGYVVLSAQGRTVHLAEQGVSNTSSSS